MVTATATHARHAAARHWPAGGANMPPRMPRRPAVCSVGAEAARQEGRGSGLCQLKEEKEAFNGIRI